MTNHPETLDEALADHDVTLALTPGQLMLLVAGVIVVVRLLKRLRR